MKLNAIFCAILVATASAAALAQGQQDDPRAVAKAALDAYQARDFASYLANSQRLLSLRPDHPRVLYNLAGAFALNGSADDAIAALARVAAMGLVMPAAKDDDFASLRDDPRFRATLARFEANARPKGSAVRAFVIDVRGAMPEGIARDPRSGDFFVSTVRQRSVYRVHEGKAFLLPIPDAQLWSAMGMKADGRGFLWIATAATTQMRDADPALVGRAAVLKYDLRSGKVTRRFDVPDDEKKHWLGDLTVDSKGNVYATDSLTQEIYRIAAGGNAIEAWITDPRIRSAQGLTFAGDDRELLVADYATGIWSVDTATKELRLLAPPSGDTILGIDGLYFAGGALIATQNGVNPQRIIRLGLDRTKNAVTTLEVLEANHPDFDELTLATIANGTIYFVASAQWESFDDSGKLKEGKTPREILVMKRKL